nr:4Fe-4S dicluster domain-containing protein [Desulfobulbaceae bacterium]
MEKGVLVDLTRCIGCRGCQVACKEWNERDVRKTTFKGDFTNPVKLSSDCYTNIQFVETEKKGKVGWSFIKNQCLHCKEPACAAACPVGALTKTAQGAVSYQFDKCIGCRYCMVACPFDIPKYEWESVSPWVQKCTFCAERIEDGLLPACIKTCPTETMLFDDYDKIVAEAKKRLAKEPGKYVKHIYGLEEAGGTNWLYISDIPFEELGFKKGIPSVSLPDYTWSVLSSIPAKVTGFVALLSAVAYFRGRGSQEEGSE